MRRVITKFHETGSPITISTYDIVVSIIRSTLFIKIRVLLRSKRSRRRQSNREGAPWRRPCRRRRPCPRRGQEPEAARTPTPPRRPSLPGARPGSPPLVGTPRARARCRRRRRWAPRRGARARWRRRRGGPRPPRRARGSSCAAAGGSRRSPLGRSDGEKPRGLVVVWVNSIRPGPRGGGVEKKAPRLTGQPELGILALPHPWRPQMTWLSPVVLSLVWRAAAWCRGPCEGWFGYSGREPSTRDARSGRLTTLFRSLKWRHGRHGPRPHRLTITHASVVTLVWFPCGGFGLVTACQPWKGNGEPFFIIMKY